MRVNTDVPESTERKLKAVKGYTGEEWPEFLDSMAEAYAAEQGIELPEEA